MKNLWACLVALAALSAPAFAQQIQVGTLVGVPVSGYDSAGRRDPFVSLIAPKRPTGVMPDARSQPGLKNIALVDVTVTGIVRRGDALMAILEGADRQSFVAHVKDRILDAVIKRIDAQGVVFVEVTDPGMSARAQEIRKSLRGAAEGSR